MIYGKNNLFPKAAILFPMLKPTCKHTTKPGPAVAAIPSKSLIFFYFFEELFQ